MGYSSKHLGYLIFSDQVLPIMTRARGGHKRLCDGVDGMGEIDKVGGKEKADKVNITLFKVNKSTK